MRSDGDPYLPDAKPEVTVSFFNISGSQVGSTYDNSATGRVVYVQKKEEPYTGKGKIRLLNNDGALDALDFTGCLTAITWGWSGGDESVDEPVWVVNQRIISKEGKNVVQLEVLSAWELMDKSKGVNAADDTDPVDSSFGSTRVWDRDTTVLDIIAEIIQAAGSFLEQWSLDSIVQLNDDGIIDVYQPLMYSRINDSDTYLIRRLLQMTESVLTFRASTGSTVNWIDQSLPGPYYTYRFGTSDHPFYVSIQGDAMVVPNRIIYVDQEPDPQKSQVSNWVGVAELATFPLGKFGELFVDPTIEDDTEAQLRADSHLVRLIAEAELGEIYAPMNCCQELYDEIEIIDDRTGQTNYGRVGQIERIYQSYSNDIEKPNSVRESYTIRIKLGGLGGGSTRIESPAAGINDIETTIVDLKTRSLTNPFVDTYQYNGQILSQHFAPIAFYEPATANTDIAGTLTDLTGCSITVECKVDSVLDLTANSFFYSLTAPAIGDTFVVSVDVDGVAQGNTLATVIEAAQAQVGSTVSRRYLIALTKGSHTIKLRGQRLVGATTWRVFGAAGQSNMVGVIYSDKNAIGAT